MLQISHRTKGVIFELRAQRAGVSGVGAEGSEVLGRDSGGGIPTARARAPSAEALFGQSQLDTGLYDRLAPNRELHPDAVELQYTSGLAGDLSSGGVCRFVEEHVHRCVRQRVAAQAGR